MTSYVVNRTFSIAREGSIKLEKCCVLTSFHSLNKICNDVHSCLFHGFKPPAVKIKFFMLFICLCGVFNMLLVKPSANPLLNTIAEYFLLKSVGSQKLSLLFFFFLQN